MNKNAFITGLKVLVLWIIINISMIVYNLLLWVLFKLFSITNSGSCKLWDVCMTEIFTATSVGFKVLALILFIAYLVGALWLWGKISNILWKWS